VDNHIQQSPETDNILPGQSLRVAVLSNPGSGRNRQGMGWIDQTLKSHPQVMHFIARDPAEIMTVLAEISHAKPDVLAINAGDGTIAAILTALMEQQPFMKQPMLALLRGGTTNMIACDVGLKGSIRQALERLLHWTHATTPAIQPVSRPLLRVQSGENQPPLYGMSFGAGAIIKGMEYCQQNILRPGLRDSLGAGLCALRILLALARNDHRYVAPVTMEFSAIPEISNSSMPRDYFLLMVTTLERLFLGSHPYWGDKKGALHFTAIQSHSRHALRTIPPIFWGRTNRHVTPENGYWSQKVDALELTMNGTFTIDGELYSTHTDQGPVRITRGGRVNFLRFVDD